jgi:segregation and condensation protein B
MRQMRVEAVLLLTKTPLNSRKLSQLAHLADATEARTLVRQLNRVYDTHGRAMRVEQVAGGYRLLTRPSLAPWLARLGHLPPPVRLSTPMMETLAVVAYRQPVSRASAEAVRGVACGELLRQLMERDLIRIVGRGEELGRPYLYGTTRRFLQLFGLPSADALPAIEWQTLQEEPCAEDSPIDDVSTSKKEPVVSTVVAPDLGELESEVFPSTSRAAQFSQANADLQQSPFAVDEDEEGEEFFEEEEDDDDDDDDDDEDWDEEDDEDWDEEVEEDEVENDLEDEEIEEEEEEDAWEEVDDEAVEEEVEEEEEEEWEDEEEEDWDDDEDEEEEEEEWD